jgi:hypothetical protein
MTVHYPNHFSTSILGVSFDHQVLLWINGVHLCRVRNVFARVKLEHFIGGTIAYQQSAGLFWITRNGVFSNGLQYLW